MEQWITLCLLVFIIVRLYKLEKCVKADKNVTIAPIAYEQSPDIQVPNETIIEKIPDMEKQFKDIGVLDASFDEDFGI